MMRSLHLSQDALSFRAAFIDVVLPAMTLPSCKSSKTRMNAWPLLDFSEGLKWPSFHHDDRADHPIKESDGFELSEVCSPLGALCGCAGLRQLVAEFADVFVGLQLRYIRGFEAAAEAHAIASHPCSEFLITKRAGSCACS